MSRCAVPRRVHTRAQVCCLIACRYHPNIYPLALRILGEGARLSGFNFGTAGPNNTAPPADPYGDALGDDTVLGRGWHREDSGNVMGADQNEYYCPAVQAIVYLDDVDHTCNCTSIIPESAETKRRLPKTRDPLERDNRHHDGLARIDDYGPFGKAGNFKGGRFHTSLEQSSYISESKPTWVVNSGEAIARRVGGVDVYAKAGSAVIFVRLAHLISRCAHVHVRVANIAHTRSGGGFRTMRPSTVEPRGARRGSGAPCGPATASPSPSSRATPSPTRTGMLHTSPRRCPTGPR